MAAPTTDPKELLHDVAKGGPVALVVAMLGWMLMGQLDGLRTELAAVRVELTTLQIDTARATGNLWTAADQRAYEQARTVELEQIKARLAHVEAMLRLD